MLKIPRDCRIYFVVEKCSGHRLKYVAEASSAYTYIIGPGLCMNLHRYAGLNIHYTELRHLVVHSVAEANTILGTDRVVGGVKFKDNYKLVLVSRYDKKLKKLYGL